MRILLIEDDQETADYLRKGLAESGHVADHAGTGPDGLAQALAGRYDALIVDRMLPGMDGLSVIRVLREEKVTTPVLILSALGQVNDRVRGLRAGGDDYLVKPFDLNELKARIRALLRRAGKVRTAPLSPPPSLLALGDLSLDPRTHEVYLGKKSLLLTPAEFDLLRYFMIHTGEVFSCQQLLEQVWGYTAETADPGLVRWHIMNLRNKIEPNPASPSYLRTVPRHGYIMDQPHS